MITKALIKHNSYTDSMSLMALSTKVNELEIVDRAMIGMATDMNKELIKNADMMTPGIEATTTSDMIIVVWAETEELCDQAMDGEEVGIVMISMPGEHATAEAEKALRQNKNVMILVTMWRLRMKFASKTGPHQQLLHRALA